MRDFFEHRKKKEALFKEEFHDLKYFAIIQFLSAIPDAEFVEYVSGFFDGIGRDTNGVGCDFCGVDGPEEEPFVGVQSYTPVESVVLSPEEFLRVLRLACDIHISLHAQDKEAIDFLWQHRIEDLKLHLTHCAEEIEKWQHK